MIWNSLLLVVLSSLFHLAAFSQNEALNAPISIQDIVVFGNLGEMGRNPTGEFGTKESEAAQSDRLYCSIEQLIMYVGDVHKTSNCQKGSNYLKEGKENNITRLVTSEFSFYTKTPLTLNEFSELLNKITPLAEKQPENMQLILSSFAVRAVRSGTQIMNVAVQVECGKEPKINLTVKNNPTKFDPAYKLKLGGDIVLMSKEDFEKLKADAINRGKLYLLNDGQYKALNLSNAQMPHSGSLFNASDNELQKRLSTWKGNVDDEIASEILKIISERELVPGLVKIIDLSNMSNDKQKDIICSIQVNGKNCQLSFNNVFECATAGGAKYHSCIDMCRDHFQGVAQKNVEAKLTAAIKNQTYHDFPLQVSQVVTSNTVNLYRDRCLGLSHAYVTHADPSCSPKSCKAKTDIMRKDSINNVFGGQLNVVITEPVNCIVLSRQAREERLFGLAANDGKTDEVKLLLGENQVNPAANNNYAIRMAAFYGHTEVVKLLLVDERVNPAADNDYAIRKAAFYGHTEVVERLLADHRVNPAADNHYALRMAVEYSRTDVVKRLLGDERVNKNPFSSQYNRKLSKTSVQKFPQKYAEKLKTLENKKALFNLLSQCIGKFTLKFTIDEENLQALSLLLKTAIENIYSDPSLCVTADNVEDTFNNMVKNNKIYEYLEKTNDAYQPKAIEILNSIQVSTQGTKITPRT